MAAILLMAAIAAWAIGTHRISYVVTHGISMNPVYYAGDLVVVVKSDSYEVGQIAAYHGVGGVETLHRIIGGDPDTGYVFKGDNNQSIDIPHPTADQLIGRAVLHVSQGGVWVRRLLSPATLGMVGFLIIGAGSPAGARTRRDLRRRRRERKAKGMAGQGGSWTAAAVVVKAVSRLHPLLRVLAVGTACCALTGLVLGVLSWMKPATQASPSSSSSGESVTFSYSAQVQSSAAYDGTVAYSPDPIYRKLAHFVDLRLQYHGKPGRIGVDARLSAQAWHSTVQLAQSRQFTADRYTGTVLLDLDGIDERVADAADAIGTDLTPVTIMVTAHIEHPDGTSFEPQLSLSLSSLQLSLSGDANSLIVSQSGRTSGGGIYPRQIAVLGHDLITAGRARTYALRLLLIAIVGIIGIGLAAVRHVPLATRAQIQRRYGHLLVPVEPLNGKQGEAVITVASVPALVKLAEKYGQMILTWTRPDGADDFVVRDDGVMYRFRITPQRPVTGKPPLSGVPHPARRSQRSAALGIASLVTAPPQHTTEATAATEPATPSPEPAAATAPDPSPEPAPAVPAEPAAASEPTPEPVAEAPASATEYPQPAPEPVVEPAPENRQPGPQPVAEAPEPVAKAPASDSPEPTPSAPESAVPAPDEEELKKEPEDSEPAKADAADEGPEAAAETPVPEQRTEPPAEAGFAPPAEPESTSEADTTESSAEAVAAEEKAEASTEKEPMPAPVLEPGPSAEEEPAAEARPEVPAEAKPDAPAQVKPETAAEAKPETAAQAPAEAKPETAAESPAPAQAQRPRRTRKPRQKPESKPDPDPTIAAPETNAAPEAKVAQETTAATVPEAEATQERTAAAAPQAEAVTAGKTPQKRAPRRKPRPRKATPSPTETKATTPMSTEFAPAEVTAKAAVDERQAAEDLADRNKDLDEAITRKAVRDQAAADRARQQRLAKSAPRDPAYDFLPRNQRPDQPED